MKKELENYLSNVDNLEKFLFEQTNFGGDKICPDFHIIASPKDKLLLKELCHPYIYYIGGTGKLKNLLNSFTNEAFHYSTLKDYLIEVEKEFNVNFMDIIIP